MASCFKKIGGCFEGLLDENAMITDFSDERVSTIVEKVYGRPKSNLSKYEMHDVSSSLALAAHNHY